MIIPCYSKEKNKLFDLEMNSIPSLDIVFRHEKKQYKVIDVKEKNHSYSLVVIEWYSKVKELIHG